jgi:hypothetical protein
LPSLFIINQAMAGEGNRTLAWSGYDGHIASLKVGLPPYQLKPNQTHRKGLLHYVHAVNSKNP